MGGSPTDRHSARSLRSVAGVVSLVVVVALSACSGSLRKEICTGKDSGNFPTYEQAGTSEPHPPLGTGSAYRTPSIASTKVTIKTKSGSVDKLRLFRSISVAGRDNELGSNISWYADVTKDSGTVKGWKRVKVNGGTGKSGMTFNNFIRTGNTLHTFDTEAVKMASKAERPRLRHRVSTDFGKSWKNAPDAPVDIGRATLDQLHPWSGITRLKVSLGARIGSLSAGDIWLMPVYSGGRLSDPKQPYRSFVSLLVSTDEGAHWKLMTQNPPFESKPLAPKQPAWGMTEGTVVQLKNGKILMAARNVFPTCELESATDDSKLGGALEWRITGEPVRSVHDLEAATWVEKSIHIPGADQVKLTEPSCPGQSSTPGRTPKDRGPSKAPTRDYGINPHLLKVRSAIMLVFGRPGNRVAWNYDGTGERWDDSRPINGNRPKKETCDDSLPHPMASAPKYDVPCFAMGSSGNTGVTYTDESTAGYIITDRCHVWSCKPKKLVKPTHGENRWWSDAKWKNPSKAKGQAVTLVRFKPKPSLFVPGLCK